MPDSDIYYVRSPGNRLQHAWNAFFNKDTPVKNYSYGSSSHRPDRVQLRYNNERSIVAPIYNRIATDVAAIVFRHARLDENERYIETIPSGINNCLSTEANLDQTGRAFIQDIVMSMFDEGCVAIVPIETTLNPIMSGAYDVTNMRTAKILEWFPEHVRVRVYNEKTGKKEDLTLPKRVVCIIENPFYAVMNERNSTVKRLIRKLNLLDSIDDQSGSGKLDLIVQVPYAIKTQARKEQAEARRKDLEEQMAGSKYGIGYTDATEKIIQLNRPVENNLMKQVEYLTSMLFSQLGMTPKVFDGTADETENLNYFNTTIEPCCAAIVDEMKRKYLTSTARTQKQTIMFFRDPFKLVPVNSLADIGDKFTRNEILSSNDMRGIIGYKPSKDPRADKLVNKNINAPEETPIEGKKKIVTMEKPGKEENDG